jgi:kynurenine formamidase
MDINIRPPRTARVTMRGIALKRIVDLSQEIYEGMPVYAGHLETKVWQHHRFQDTARNFDSDFAYQSLGITFCDHGPTHVDALSHLDPRPDAPTIDRMDLAQFCGEGTCLHHRGSTRAGGRRHRSAGW